MPTVTIETNRFFHFKNYDIFIQNKKKEFLVSLIQISALKMNGLEGTDHRIKFRITPFYRKKEKRKRRIFLANLEFLFPRFPSFLYLCFQLLTWLKSINNNWYTVKQNITVWKPSTILTIIGMIKNFIYFINQNVCLFHDLILEITFLNKVWCWLELYNNDFRKKVNKIDK